MKYGNAFEKPQVIKGGLMEILNSESVILDRQLDVISSKMLDRIMQFREKYIAAFIAETGLRPSECFIVEQYCTSSRSQIWIEKKEGNKWYENYAKKFLKEKKSHAKKTKKKN